jgi:ABC-type glycerol-3-phosphate transport system permease component
VVAPGAHTLVNFAEAWDAAPFLIHYANTIVICSGILVVQLFTITLAGYVFARVPFHPAGAGGVCIVTVTFHWNDFLWPLLVTNTPAARPLTVGLASFATAGENGAQFPLIMAGSLLVMAPVLIGFLLFQRQFVASFVQSGFK